MRCPRSQPRHGSFATIHDVRVRETEGGEIVNFHCVVDQTLSVANVHERVDEVERALRLRFPSIKRVIGHAEPRAGLDKTFPHALRLINTAAPCRRPSRRSARASLAAASG